MKKLVFSVTFIGIYIVLICNGLGLELSGTILDENGAPRIIQNIILVKNETAEEIMSIDGWPIDTAKESDEIGWSCRSDESGYYIFSNLTSGAYALCVWPSTLEKEGMEEGYEYVATHFELSSENISDLIIKPVQVEYYIVHGELRSEKTGLPIIAEVLFHSPTPTIGTGLSMETGRELMVNTQTDENGVFLKSNVPPGNYSLLISNTNEPSLTPFGVTLPIYISNDGEIIITDSDLQWLSHYNLDLKLWSTKERKEKASEAWSTKGKTEKASEAQPELLPDWSAESYTINVLESDYVVLRATLENEENPPSGNKPIQYRVNEVLKGELDSDDEFVQIADVMDAAVQLLKGNPVATYFPQEAILIVALSDGIYTPLDALASRGILPATPENIQRVEASSLENLTENPAEKQLSLQEAAAIVKRYLAEQNQWSEKASWMITRMGFGWGFHSNSEGRDLELYVRDDGKVEYFVNWENDGTNE